MPDGDYPDPPAEDGKPPVITPSNVIPMLPVVKPRPSRPMEPKTQGAPKAGSGGVRCKARTKSGEQCKKYAIAGGTVCPTHGGSAPQVKKRAAMRLLELIDPAITTLAREMATATRSSDRQRAANSILDRAGVVRREAPQKEDVYDLVAERLRALREGNAG